LILQNSTLNQNAQTTQIINLINQKANPLLDVLMQNTTQSNVPNITNQLNLAEFLKNIFQIIKNGDTPQNAVFEMLKNNPTIKNSGSFGENIKELVTMLNQNQTQNSQTVNSLLTHIKNLQPQILQNSLLNSGIFLESNLLKMATGGNTQMQDLTKDIKAVLLQLKNEIQNAKPTVTQPNIQPQTQNNPQIQTQIPTVQTPIQTTQTAQTPIMTQQGQQIAQAPQSQTQQQQPQTQQPITQQPTQQSGLQTQTQQSNQPNPQPTQPNPTTPQQTQQPVPNTSPMQQPNIQQPLQQNQPNILQSQFTNQTLQTNTSQNQNINNSGQPIQQNPQNTSDIHTHNTQNQRHQNIPLLMENNPYAQSNQQTISAKVQSSATQSTESTQAQQSTPNQNILNQADKLIAQIEYFQLLSIYGNGNYFYMPFYWEDLVGGTIYTRKDENKTYCEIDLELQSYGNIKAMVSLFGKETIDISFSVQNQDFKAILQDNLKLLRGALNKAEFNLMGIKIIDKQKNTNPYAQNLDQSSQMHSLDIKI